MNVCIHPKSGVQVQGMQLVRGVVLQKSDLYDSTSGKWENCPCVGGTVPNGQHVVWIRPNTELSAEGKVLLTYLTQNNFLLTYLYWWKVIPSPRWRYDGRMDWRVLQPECVQELIDFGFVSALSPREIDYGYEGIFHSPQENEIYQVTEAGHALAKSLCN